MAPAFLDAMVSQARLRGCSPAWLCAPCLWFAHGTVSLLPVLGGLAQLALTVQCWPPPHLRQASSPAEVKLWEGVLRDSFAALKGFSFLDADKAEGMMKR